jgi:hypothetical protein
MKAYLSIFGLEKVCNNPFKNKKIYLKQAKPHKGCSGSLLLWASCGGGEPHPSKTAKNNKLCLKLGFHLKKEL